MRKSAAFLAALLAAAVLLTAGGCSARSAVSPEDFQKKAEGLGYSVQAQTSSQAGAEKELSAAKDGSDVQVAFTDFGTAADAMSAYSAVKEGLPSAGGKTLDTDAYNRYAVTNGEIYYALVRMDHTVLSCKAAASKKKDVDALVSAIKY